jgi:hypothetical protein
MHFIEIYADGRAQSAGLSPYLDYAVPTDEELPLVQNLLKTNSWWTNTLSVSPEELARNYAISTLCPSHLQEIEKRRIDYVDRVKKEVEKRLSNEIAYQDALAGKYYDEAASGKLNAAANAAKAEERARQLEQRKKDRLTELELERQISSGLPVILGGAWIVPRSMLIDKQAAGEADKKTQQSTQQAKTAIEIAGMKAVITIEREMGNIPRDVSKENIGYDIESETPDKHLRFIEVKGRMAGSDFVTVTHNELQTAINSPGNYILAVVEVDSDTRKITYCTQWADHAPSFAETSTNFNLAKLFKSCNIALTQTL